MPVVGFLPIKPMFNSSNLPSAKISLGARRVVSSIQSVIQDAGIRGFGHIKRRDLDTA